MKLHEKLLCFNFEKTGSVMMTNKAFHGAGGFKGVINLIYTTNKTKVRLE